MAVFILATALHNLQCNNLLKVCIMIKGGSSVFCTVKERMLPSVLCVFVCTCARSLIRLVKYPLKIRP